MKKLRLILALTLVAALLAACGGAPAGTTAPTTVPTEAPTTVPTEAPTTAPTEPPLEPIVNFYFDEPEGFTVFSSAENVQILAGPIGDGSSITVMMLPTPMDLSELTEENFAESLGLLGDESQAPELNAMEALQIDDYPACLMDYTMTSGGITARYYAYYITDNRSTVALLFADATADGSWADEYAAAAGTIELLVEGEYVPADTTGLEQYDLGCGLSMYAAPGMELVEVEGFAAVLADSASTIMFIEDNKEEYGLYGLTVEDYASLYVDGESILGFEKDACGNVATSFVGQGDDGVSYFYYVVAKNTADNFYLVQIACAQENAMVMAGEYAQWCATITETP